MNQHKPIVKAFLFFMVATTWLMPKHVVAQNELQQAIAQDDAALIKQLANKDKRVLSKPLPQMRITPLHFAIQNGKPTATRTLLDLGAPIGNANNRAVSPLHVAMMFDNTSDVVDAILASKPDLNAVDTNQATPLMYAIMYRRQTAEIAEKLIQAGAAVQHTNKSQQTALHLACYYNSPEIAKALINAGADVNAADNNQNTPFLAACSSCPDVVELMIKKGAKLSVANRQQQTALHLACQSNRDTVVRAVIERFSDVNIADANGQTPLVQAIIRQNVSITKLLLSRGANPNLINQSSYGRNQTTLCLAASIGQQEIVKALLDANAGVNLIGKDGESPLHSVVRSGGQMRNQMQGNPRAYPKDTMERYVSITKELLERGANPNLKNSSSQIPIQVAAEGGFFKAVELLVDSTNDLSFNVGEGSLLHWASKNGLPKTAKRIVDATRPDMNQVDTNGNTPLQLAAGNGHGAMVEMLVSLKANVNQPDTAGMTPLMLAANLGNARSVNALVKAGADVSRQDASGQVAIHFAAWSGEKDAIAALCEGKANPNAATPSGYTPLLAAAWNGHLGAVQVLVNHGANVNQRDSDGWSPLHKAAYRGHAPVVKWLLQKGADKTATNAVGMTAASLAPSDNNEIQQLLKQ
ncbi:MAG: ankyrin repeat domain-containing protein [Planctomycetota bacterium]